MQNLPARGSFPSGVRANATILIIFTCTSQVNSIFFSRDRHDPPCERKIQIMKITAYVNFPGSCRQALEYYAQHLGGKILVVSTWDQMPGAPSVPPGLDKNSVLHARIQIGETLVMASDGPKVEPMRSAYLCISVDSNEEAERIYKALTDGGEVFMAMGETFFAHRFGQLRDKFGVNWMVIHEKPMPARG
jgi:PhnB protein